MTAPSRLIAEDIESYLPVASNDRANNPRGPTPQ
jgi:hypothetical protein